jgi:hypothetical protein
VRCLTYYDLLQHSAFSIQHSAFRSQELGVRSSGIAEWDGGLDEAFGLLGVTIIYETVN